MAAPIFTFTLSTPPSSPTYNPSSSPSTDVYKPFHHEPLFNLEHSDATFLCRDGVEVKTFKAVNKYADPIKEALALAEDSVVKLDKYDGATIQRIVDLIHTPTIHIYVDTSAELKETLCASRFLGVEEVAKGRLHVKITSSMVCELFRTGLDMDHEELVRDVLINVTDGGMMDLQAFIEATYEPGDFETLRYMGLLVDNKAMKGYYRLYLFKPTKYYITPSTIAKLMIKNKEADKNKDMFALCLTQMNGLEQRELADMVVANGVGLSPELFSTLINVSAKKKRGRKPQVQRVVVDVSEDSD